MTIIPGPADLARWFLRILKDLGYWKPADPPRPPAPPLPSDDSYANTQQVYDAFLTMNNTQTVKNHAFSIKQWIDGCPRLTTMP